MVFAYIFLHNLQPRCQQFCSNSASQRMLQVDYFYLFDKLIDGAHHRKLKYYRK